jgi:hypothetical protein
MQHIPNMHQWAKREEVFGRKRCFLCGSCRGGISETSLKLWRSVSFLRYNNLISVHVLKIMLAHSLTEVSPSREAANCAVTQEFPSNLWNPNVQYHVLNNPPLVPILSHFNLIYTIPSYLSRIHFNIVQPT